MKELAFSHGRLSYSQETSEMTPCLTGKVEAGIQYHFYSGDMGFIKGGFQNFELFARDRELRDFIWLHLTGEFEEDFWQGLKKSLALTDEQLKQLRSPHARSFFEEYPEELFWSLQRASVSQDSNALEVVNFMITPKVLVTRQFSQDFAFSSISHKLMSQAEQLHDFTVDKLSADLIEDIIQSFIDALVIGGAKLEKIQNRIIKNPGKEELKLINFAQQIIWVFYNALWPVETILQAVLRSKNPLISIEGRAELVHSLEEASSVLRLFETYREMSYDLMDVYVSGLGLKTNETTRILTIIATIFLPPSLIASIYGMNFDIPEVSLHGGYYICLFLMFAVSGGLVWWLRKHEYIEF